MFVTQNVLIMEEMNPILGAVQDDRNAIEIHDAAFSWDSEGASDPETGEPLEAFSKSCMVLLQLGLHGHSQANVFSGLK